MNLFNLLFVLEKTDEVEKPLLLNRLLFYKIGLATSALFLFLTVISIITNANSDINFKKVLDFKKEYEALDSASLQKDSIKIKFREYREMLIKHKEERKGAWGQIFIKEEFDSLSLEIRIK